MAHQENNPLLADMHPKVAEFWGNGDYDYDDDGSGLCDVVFEFDHEQYPVIIEAGAPCHYCLNNKYTVGRSKTRYISTSLREAYYPAFAEFYQFICNPILSPWKGVLKDSALIYSKGHIVAVRLKITEETDAQLLGSFCIATRVLSEYNYEYELANWWNQLREKNFNLSDTLYIVLNTYLSGDVVNLSTMGDGHYPVKVRQGVHYHRFVTGTPKLHNKLYLRGADYDGCSSIFDDVSNKRIKSLFIKNLGPYKGSFKLYRDTLERNQLDFSTPVEDFLDRLKDELPKWKQENNDVKTI